MNKKFKQALWSIGTLVVSTTPIIAVVACSKDTPEPAKVGDGSATTPTHDPVVTTHAEAKEGNLIIDSLKNALTPGGILSLASLVGAPTDELKKALDGLTVENSKIDQALLDEAKATTGTDTLSSVTKYLARFLEKRLANPTQADVDALKGFVQSLFIDNRKEIMSILAIATGGDLDETTVIGKLYSSLITPINDVLSYIKTPPTDQHSIDVGAAMAKVVGVNVDSTDADSPLAGVVKYLPLLAHLDILGAKIHKVIISVIDLFDEKVNPGFGEKFSKLVGPILHFIDPSISTSDFLRDVFALVSELINDLILPFPNEFLTSSILPSLFSILEVDLSTIAAGMPLKDIWGALQTFVVSGEPNFVGYILGNEDPAHPGTTLPWGEAHPDSDIITRFDALFKLYNDHVLHPDLTSEIPFGGLLRGADGSDNGPATKAALSGIVQRWKHLISTVGSILVDGDFSTHIPDGLIPLFYSLAIPAGTETDLAAQKSAITTWFQA